MNTAENNKLIATFMGIKSYPYRGYTMFEFEDNNHRTEIDLHYHASWEWLMLVVEKIETLFDNGVDVSILTVGTIITLWRRQKEIIRLTSAEIDFDSKIEHVYKAVVEFIKWYNENGKI